MRVEGLRWNAGKVDENRDNNMWSLSRKVGIRLPGKTNSYSHGARPVHQIISMIKWIRTRRLSIKTSLSAGRRGPGPWR